MAAPVIIIRLPNTSFEIFDAFWIDETPVTNHEFACFVGATGQVINTEIVPKIGITPVPTARTIIDDRSKDVLLIPKRVARFIEKAHDRDIFDQLRR